MWFYIVKRTCLFIPTFLLIVFANFAVLEWLPGSPLEYVYAGLDECMGDESADVQGAVNIPQELHDHLVEQYELHLPFWVRFKNIIWRYMTFDLGTSYATGESVSSMVFRALPATLIVGLTAFVFLYLLGVPIGLYQSFVAFSLADTAFSTVFLTLYAMPTVLLCMLYLFAFSEGLISDYFPSSSGLVKMSWTLSGIANMVWYFFLPVLT